MKNRTIFACRECGNETAKWQGQCGACNEWNSLVEIKRPDLTASAAEKALALVGAGAKKQPHSTQTTQKSTLKSLKSNSHYAGKTGVARFSEILGASREARFSSSDPEFDRVLGGGLVEGSVILLGGEPGIGKSTLSLTIAAQLSQSRTVIYVSGEESLEQIALRGQRLELDCSQDGEFLILAETRLERILEELAVSQPSCIVIDSIQTLVSESSNGAAGSVSQLRECTGILVNIAKRLGICVLLIGHVTKQGQIAGPRILEHMVDTVLYFESDPASRYRFIRAVKNRFGAADELAVYAMLESGLKPVSNPSAIFLQQRRSANPGSVCFATRQGTRQLLVEIQALVDEVPSPHARRVALGLDAPRLNMLLAVMHRRAGVEFFSDDVYLNVVGGLDASEIASDVPMLMAVLSAKREKAWPVNSCAFGEVGLSGEIRPVPYGHERIEEAVRQGFDQCILPFDNLPKAQVMKGLKGKIELKPIKHLRELMETFQRL